jgi:hypothetical protein
MKQLLIILLFISTLTKAQDTIKIPTPVAKQIAKESGYNFIYLTFAATEDVGDIIGYLNAKNDVEV